MYVPINLVESEEYLSMKQELGDPLMMDMVEESFGLELARNPLSGVEVVPHIYVVETEQIEPNMPSYKLTYRYDPDTSAEYLELLAIELTG